ncbi:hypothetical protein [Pseudomonas sp. MH9.3]|uniref:hypothetical protein n=1 Tax=Pseudomonas sp. MH9.3 TaxID=3048630 RepID=UPI002AC8DBA9|nr:hypothetical protein [Pseudomonas sp. MH9.3]MEB0108264.1 hypothetical protein [Pseudomonas sp. MH9.3]WPX80464.1 hypothetical protein RHM60_04940 [Pseudomonas sp. MH9.3]WQG57602.1 hypothetical protein RHM66_21885 [Pseudomonas sp. RTB3]
MSDFGYCEGDTCRRNGCKGVIQMRKAENCSCHISPHCSACTAPRHFCDACEWDEADDEIINDFIVNVDKTTGNYRSWEPRPLDPRTIDYRIKSHTNSSQICEGVYPEGTTREEVQKLVIGTFGGRFEHFGKGKFKYIAYTD